MPLQGHGSPQDLANSSPWPMDPHRDWTPALPRPLQARSVPQRLRRAGPLASFTQRRLFRDPGAGQQTNPTRTTISPRLHSP